MKRCYSLKKNRDFTFTYRLGKSVGCQLCTLVYVQDRRKPRPSRSQTPPPEPNVRVGFSVSKKVGNSVKRNRVKRRLRAAVTPLIPSIRTGYILIFIARAAILDEPYGPLCRAVEHLVKKAGLLAH